MRELRKIAVFCGASPGCDAAYAECARKLGEEMVRRKIGLVYGGGNVGLMGIVATTVGAGLGEEHVIGVIPKALEPREASLGERSATELLEGGVYFPAPPAAPPLATAMQPVRVVGLTRPACPPPSSLPLLSCIIGADQRLHGRRY
jgi:hypothetical protein